MPIQVPQQGWSQMTAAQRQLIASVGGSSRSTSPKRKTASRKSARSARAAPSRKRSASSKVARLVKGSKAAKAYMAKIRRKRK